MIIKLFLDSQLRAFFIFKQNQLNLIFHFFKIYSKSYKEQYKSNALIHFLLLNLFWSKFKKKKLSKIDLGQNFVPLKFHWKSGVSGLPSPFDHGQKTDFYWIFQSNSCKVYKKILANWKKIWPIELSFYFSQIFELSLKNLNK